MRVRFPPGISFWNPVCSSPPLNDSRTVSTPHHWVEEKKTAASPGLKALLLQLFARQVPLLYYLLRNALCQKYLLNNTKEILRKSRWNLVESTQLGAAGKGWHRQEQAGPPQRKRAARLIQGWVSPPASVIPPCLYFSTFSLLDFNTATVAPEKFSMVKHICDLCQYSLGIYQYSLDNELALK